MTCDTVILTADQARKKNILVRRRPPADDPTLTVGKRPKCICKVRNDKQNEKVKEYLCARLGIVKKLEPDALEDEEEDGVALEDDDGALEEGVDSIALDEEDGHPNPFIL